MGHIPYIIFVKPGEPQLNQMLTSRDRGWKHPQSIPCWKSADAKAKMVKITWETQWFFNAPGPTATKTNKNQRFGSSVGPCSDFALSWIKFFGGASAWLRRDFGPDFRSWGSAGSCSLGSLKIAISSMKIYDFSTLSFPNRFTHIQKRILFQCFCVKT